MVVQFDNDDTTIQVPIIWTHSLMIILSCL